jgi:Right handed beta helix region
MSRLGVLCTAASLSLPIVLAAGRASATSNCQFSVRHETMTLRADCTTDETILVPEGFTLRGRGFTVTAVDPPGAHFLGAVIRNAGSRANVEDVQITASNLVEVCDSPENELRGIELNGASGWITGNVIRDLNQAAGTSGCQEGDGIVAQSFGAAINVRIEGNTVDAYQKTGIVVSGNAHAVLRGNATAGFGPVDFIAQNGIQIAFGAEATVERNVVRGNSYTGTAGGVQASGILVVSGPTLSGCGVSPCPFSTGLRISHNLLLENDVGVLLDNAADASGAAPETPTLNRIEDNAIFKSSLTNGSATQVGIFDIGNGDRIERNTIGGAGYDPAANPGAFTKQLFVELPFASNAVIRGNRLLP